MEYEERLFTEAVIQKANEAVLYQMECGDVQESGIFNVAVCFTFSKSDPYYYEKHFNKALLKRVDARVRREIKGITYARWSVDEDGKELLEGKSNEIKRQREEIQKWNGEHKVRVLTMFCELTAESRQFRFNVTQELCTLFKSFIIHVTGHPERDAKASDESFKVTLSMQYFAYAVDKMFNNMYKAKRGNGIPEYAKKAIFQMCVLPTPILHLTKLTIDAKKITVETDIYIPNKYKKVKKETTANTD